MAYKSGGTENIKDDNTVIFNKVTVKNHYTIDDGPGQGNVSGYATGGLLHPSSTWYNTIDKYPFSSDANASDVGDLSQARTSVGVSSSSHGYTGGGWLPGRSNVIDRFPFSTDGNAVDVGDLIFQMSSMAPAMSSTHGYYMGGYTSPPFLLRNEIQRFPFAVATTNASNVGDLIQIVAATAGHSDTSYGYKSGGRMPPADPTYGASNIIERFPFAAASTNSTDVGDLTQRVASVKGCSSATHGYSIGGASDVTSTGTMRNSIQKFPFASSANSTNVAALVSTLKEHSASSSTTHGYATGGATLANPSTQSGTNVIQKFPFASDTNASDVGDLTVGRRDLGANEV